MQNKARFFAYATWVVMISLAIILAGNRLLGFVSDPGWVGLVALLAFGFIYLNISYISVKRFIRKVPEPTSLHYVLAALIFLPPAFWIIAVSEQAAGSELILILVLVFSCWLGAFYGNRTGIRVRHEYIREIKKRQAEQEQQQHS